MNRSAMITCAERVSSVIDITDSSDELLTSVITSLVSGGVMRRSDCGSRMNRIDCRSVMPIDSAASVWPASIDCRPARTISAMNPAELNASATTPLQNEDNSKPMRGSAK